MTIRDIQRRYGVRVCLLHCGDIPRNWTGYHDDSHINVNSYVCENCLKEAEATLIAIEKEFESLFTYSQEIKDAY